MRENTERSESRGGREGVSGPGRLQTHTHLSPEILEALGERQAGAVARRGDSSRVGGLKGD